VSITLNPLAYSLIQPSERLLRGRPPIWAFLDRQGEVPEGASKMKHHVVIAGYGRVGELAGHALLQLNVPFVVIEADLGLARRLASAGIATTWGDSATPEVLHMASVEHARLLVVAVPDESSSLLTVANARRIKSDIDIIVRAREAGELEILRDLGAREVVVPEFEGGLEMMRQTLLSLGFDSEETLLFASAVRDIHYGDDRAGVHGGGGG
ncbi:MAG TPA: NAD(P)-binding protein, partial [Tepidiformaceae bacterium]|nr:NAD(P)-binding protein [Tepidiformaceae bacterium]